ncbi:hypothetical protein SM033_00196 [Vibrio phage vB_VpaM_sm033]|nr:hypothetical protein SM033_00196 [Vibrio phage vB_VpaM_sm033]
MDHSCIGYCIKRVMTDIDINLLERAFRPRDQWHAYDTYNLEYYIENEVIRDYVMTDLNLVSGQAERIPIYDLPFQQINNAHVYRIPLTRTHGRRITAVHSVEHGYADGGMGDASLTQVLAEATMGPQATGTARTEIVAPNTIAIYEHSIGWNSFIRVNLEHDENLQNINPRFQRDIAKLCTAAAKHLIHVKLANKIGDGESFGGAPSDYVRSTIDSYSDQKDIYEELLDAIPKKMLLNDRKQANRIARWGISR